MMVALIAMTCLRLRENFDPVTNCQPTAVDHADTDAAVMAQGPAHTAAGRPWLLITENGRADAKRPVFQIFALQSINDQVAPMTAIIQPGLNVRPGIFPGLLQIMFRDQRNLTGLNQLPMSQPGSIAISLQALVAHSLNTGYTLHWLTCGCGEIYRPESGCCLAATFTIEPVGSHADHITRCAAADELFFILFGYPERQLVA